MKNVIEFVRAFVRPFLVYYLVGILGVLVILAFNKFGDADLARTLIVGFIGLLGPVVGFYIRDRVKTTGGSKK